MVLSPDPRSRCAPRESASRLIPAISRNVPDQTFDRGHWPEGAVTVFKVATLPLQALNTGHGGSLTTVHANNAESALSRLASCAMQGGGDLPWDVTCRGVVDGISMVIHMTRREGRRFVEEAAFVNGYDAGTNQWDIQQLNRVTV